MSRPLSLRRRRMGRVGRARTPCASPRTNRGIADFPKPPSSTRRRMFKARERKHRTEEETPAAAAPETDTPRPTSTGCFHTETARRGRRYALVGGMRIGVAVGSGATCPFPARKANATHTWTRVWAPPDYLREIRIQLYFTEETERNLRAHTPTEI